VRPLRSYLDNKRGIRPDPVWNDKNGEDFVHGPAASAAANDVDFINNANPLTQAAVAAAGVAGFYYTVASVQCGELHSKRFQFIPAAHGGNAVGARDCT